MRKIRRAAVTGLLAVWLAPLPSLDDAAGPEGERVPFIEQPAQEDDHARQGWHSVSDEPKAPDSQDDTRKA